MQFWNWDVQVGRGRVSFASVTEGWGGRTQKFQCYTPAAQGFGVTLRIFILPATCRTKKRHMETGQTFFCLSVTKTSVGGAG